MKSLVGTTGLRISLLVCALYGKSAFATGLTSGLNDTSVVVMIFLFFFVLPATGLSIVFLIARIFCKKRKLTKGLGMLNWLYLFFILALLSLAIFLSYAN